ncbi:target of Sbf [Saxophila tyrrhenica]|uniref:glucan endo-1,3-beta-D-glucosidase n=1 Tax=Saxophila tyrrhenica TaxID=1690608 RepID=A0AAV9PGW0_9PEZI|nr:target of Sbf [Saxophila tyrrhenica]
MKRILAAALLLAVATAQDNACEDDGGNFYCQLVNAITYTSVGGSGTYQKITDMDSTSGSCASSPYDYAGSIAPLDEEVSWHVRGPTILKQFAAYTPDAPTVKKSKRNQHVRRHAQGSGSNHKHHGDRIQERQVGATVTATIEGIVQTWINEYDGLPTETTSTAEADYPSGTGFPANMFNSTDPSNITVTGNGWGRNAFYNADNQTSEGLVFLNHFGGSGSGVFDYSFGNSLSYAGADGNCGASGPETLARTTLPSSAEVVLMSDQQCEDDSCGYVRPGTVAHHGWDGTRKAFFFEFQMPDSGETTNNIYDPVNMPAIWMLNAQIPRTLQYGNEDCSCWGSGCGEFDMFEVLSPGSTKAKSTLHGNKAGGDSNYFDRPLDKTIKVGMVMYDDNIHIKVLDDDMEFPSMMDEETINEILQSTIEASMMVSLFSLAESAAG